MKKGLVCLIMWFLGRGFQACVVLDPNIKAIVSNWRESTTFLLKVDPFGPCMVMKVHNEQLIYVGSKEMPVDFKVSFKNLEAAILVLTAQIGIAQAFAEHRFAMKGDINTYGMPLVQCLYSVENYLFPSFISRRILKRVPPKYTSSVRVYVKTLFGV